MKVVTESDKDRWVFRNKFDGMGASLMSPSTFRIQVNLELSGSHVTISETSLDKDMVKETILQTIGAQICEFGSSGL
jgi:hypothetical protein